MVVMQYLLDTNVCINLLRNDRPAVTARFVQVGVAACAISEIVEAELRVGAESSQRPDFQHALIDQLAASLAVLPVAPAIRLYARERARLQASGQLIDSFDLLIGSTALAHGLIMVTNNSRHFARIQGLPLEDWTVPRAPSSSVARPQNP